MKLKIACALVVSLAFVHFARAADAAPLSAAAIAPARVALDAIEARDRAKFVAAFAAGVTIVDEISPFHFAGEDAAGRWFDRLAAVNRANAISGEHTTIARAPRGAVEGNDAYAVVDVRIGYREHSRAIVENGAWTFALKNEGETWKIVVAVFAPMPTATPQTR